MNELLKCFAEKFSSSGILEECVTSCFRCLRQACALNAQVRDQLTSCPDLLTNTKVILQTKYSQNAESDSQNMLKCCVQFLGNACADSAENRKLIWSTVSDKLRFVSSLMT